ncbi:MAG: hypothetical protein IPO67_06870 [Deltaproteobacteria bacterium]|nr:hypothetical protein [Deltaproteobacteria bacterium]
MSRPRAILSVLPLIVGCGDGTRRLGDYTVEFDKDEPGALVLFQGEPIMQLTSLAVGDGESEIEFAYGSYTFTDAPPGFAVAAPPKVRGNKEADEIYIIDLEAADGALLGELRLSLTNDDALTMGLYAERGDMVRMGFACGGPDDVFLGAGAQAFDVNHGGEAFSLWVSEPGIGKVDSENPPEDWFIQGTRHSSSAPIPFLLRPDDAVGIEIDAGGRVDLDLCKTAPGTYTIGAWDTGMDLHIFAGSSAMDVLSQHGASRGGPAMPPDWAFAPWNDAIRGAENVIDLANFLRAEGIPSSVIWTEDWKGGEDTIFGYHLSGEWTIDSTLYPDAGETDSALEQLGFKWLAYFSPFVFKDSSVWAEAETYVIRTQDNAPYTFLNATLDEVSVLDLSWDESRAWAQTKMDLALTFGFDGWMADFAEWMPPDARLNDMDPILDHNLYPVLWQELSYEVLEDRDAVFFARSGWAGSHAYTPIMWLGDQQTDWSVDDGYPSVVPMALGLSMSGVPFIGFDIGGYSTVGTEPTSKELWFRWVSLAAFAPIMRTHHGAFDTANWRFDSDAETIAHYKKYAVEHTRLFPYIRGLAAQAEAEGTPLLLHPGLLYSDWPWLDVSAWMLGSSLLVTPVLGEGEERRAVTLPALGEEQTWYNYWTGEPVQSGVFDAPVGDIPVFVPPGTLLPVYTDVPDTLVRVVGDIVDIKDADAKRTLHAFGEGGQFIEADGTSYYAEGKPSKSETVTMTLASGELSVGGVTVTITGDVEREYTLVVHP